MRLPSDKNAMATFCYQARPQERLLTTQSVKIWTEELLGHLPLIEAVQKARPVIGPPLQSCFWKLEIICRFATRPRERLLTFLWYNVIFVQKYLN
jgi:hypothetical protein